MRNYAAAAQYPKPLLLPQNYAPRRGPRNFEPMLRLLFRLAPALPALLLLLTLTGCGTDAEWDCVKSTGHTATQRRALRPFRWVELQDNLEVELVPDTASFVEITGGDHLLPKITTEQAADGRLLIRNRNRCNWVRSYRRALTARVHFTGSYLRISQKGSGRIWCAPGTRIDTLFLVQLGAGDIDLDVQSRYIWGQQYEYGDVRLRGTTNLISYELRGTGFFYAQDLTAGTAFISSFYDGVPRVRATQQLGIRLFGAADAYYYGQPTISDFQERGQGRVRPGT